MKHYRLAIKLRPNFVLAALNLGSYQYTSLGKTREAIESFRECGFGMNATSSRSRHKPERVAIECLINGAKLHMSESGSLSDEPAASEANSSQHQQGRRRDYQLDAGEQTNGSPAKQTTSGQLERPGCKRALQWLQSAKLKAIELGADAGWSPSGAGSGELQWIGDLNKQLATIHWLIGRCTPDEQARRNQLDLSIHHAFKSQVSIPTEIYTDYADLLGNAREDAQQGESSGGGGDNAPVRLLQRAIQLEQVKRSAFVENNRADLGRLHYALARSLESLKGTSYLDLARIELGRALELDPDNPDYLTAAGQFAYEAKSLERSETFYMRALQALQRQLFHQDAQPDKIGFDGCQLLLSDANQPSGLARSRKLGSAHTNYGAILQVNGRLEEARQQYRWALDCDPNNRAASSNLQRLQ